MEITVSLGAPRQGRDKQSLTVFLIFGTMSGPHGAASWCLSLCLPLGPLPPSPQGLPEETGGRQRGPTVRDTVPLAPHWPAALVTSTECPVTAGLHPLRGFSAPPPGLPALSLFFLRRLSIQLELERAVKLDSARELSRMFLPDMMSSPKPSWCEKA